jgi:4-amino-4-deoxy-L-arabinose transferase-like glycosyltransferase
MTTEARPIAQHEEIQHGRRTATWTRWEWLSVVVISVLALTVRLFYVHTAIVESPLRGDTQQYFAYALNLVDHHVFSMALPGTPPTPDSFRDPGYPVFLALIVSLFGREQGFYLATLDIQATLAAATVALYTLLARRFFGMRIAVFVGLGLTFWPHTITLPGYVLSETLMGTLVALGIYLTHVASEQKRPTMFALAGLTLAAATLTNATFAPVAPLFAFVAICRDAPSRKLWGLFLIAALLPTLVWSARNISLPPGQTSGDRVAMNLVQGAWPEFHDAWRSSIENRDAPSIAIMQEIDTEYQLVKRDHVQGLVAMGKRMHADPIRYARWYVSKPLELWGWSIGVGMGDIYVFPTYNSPLSGHGILRATTDALFFAAPIVLGLAAVGLILLALSREGRPPALRLAAVIAVVVTAIYATLQCDARYSTPYRGIEWLLVGVTLQALSTRFSSKPRNL